MSIMLGINQVMRIRGYQMSVTSSGEAAEYHDELGGEIARLRNDNVAGMILFPVSDFSHDEDVAKLQADGMPVVLVDRYLPDQQTDYVVSDNYSGGYRMTEYLIILGHQRIGFVYNHQAGLQTTSVHERWSGYKQALSEYGIAYDESLVFQNKASSRPEADRKYEAYLKQDNRPSAIFAVKDLVAVELLQIAQRIGIRIPEDLAITGFDNLKLAAYVSPTLTTIEQSVIEMGIRAGNILIDRIEGFTGPSQQIQLPTNLIVRESCGARMRIKRKSTE